MLSLPLPPLLPSTTLPHPILRFFQNNMPRGSSLTSVFGWVNSHAWAGIDIAPYPKLGEWVERIRARPAVKAGLEVPVSQRKKDMTKEEQEEEAKKAAAWIFKDQKKE
jgi:hypothetical protein